MKVLSLPERLPTQTQLLANYPNPFNSETWIPVQLSQDAEVRLTIYDVTGKTIRKMQLGHLSNIRQLQPDSNLLREKYRWAEGWVAEVVSL